MKVKGLIFRLTEICERHNIDPSSVTIKFDNIDIDHIIEYNNGIITLHKNGFLK